ncbi:T9SS type A sorting domain-containing protein [Rubrivirga sp. IMCC45206]|uniref:T9SS type A sorting domain-containing protein n=1 Tax=Rubrivirga sp. IMCC45206 TaxID=3391614 RepID=UPI00398FD8FE
MRHLYSSLLVGLLLAAAPASAQITVANSGDWSDPATWSTGAVPTAADDVVVDSTVTIDIADAVANNVTVTGDEGWLRTGRGIPGTDEKGLTVFGDLVIDGPDAQLRPLSNVDENDVGQGEIYHRLTVHGSIDNSTGGTFDMRRGSTSGSDPDASFIDLIFDGSDDATLHLGDYDNDDNQLFRVTIAKDDGATVTMLNDATVDNNSRAVFTLESGYLDTGDFRFTLISNNSQVVQGGSPASYVLGEFARGLPKGTVGDQSSRGFPLGDASGYRPATVYVTDRPSDDQFMGVRLISDAPAGALEGGLMELSPNRHYAFEWYFFDSADPISLDRVEVSYGTGDGVPEGSSDFVVASSTDGGATWTNAGGVDEDGTTPHVTSLVAPPTPIGSGELTGWDFDFEVVGTDVVGDVHYAAVGTTAAFGTAVETPVRGAFELAVAPNPAAGRATVSFALVTAGEATVEVFDVLGRRVATLADGPLAAGDHALTWTGAAPGLYVVRLRAGAEAGVQTVTVVR